MAKKYLSLTEAAEMLQIDPEELKALREQGEIRGFADRGNWKFRSEDVENLGRSRQADSDPEVPILGAGESGTGLGEIGESDDADALASVLDSDDPGEDPTIIRKKDEDLSKSDSDVRLIVDDSVSLADSEPEVTLGEGSDSDVVLAAESGVLSGSGLLAGTVGEMDAIAGDDGSDSDVQLVPTDEAEMADPIKPDSDSDVRLSDNEIELPQAPTSDSDVKLVDVSSDAASDDSVEIAAVTGSDSDVVLPVDEDEDSGIALEFDDDDDDAGASVLLSDDADDSGITLEEGSGLLLSGDSGISLEMPSDSGVALDMDDEGISLAEDTTSLEAVGDSGISLEADSGIALADDVEVGGPTLGEMDAFDEDGIPETQFSIPAEEGDSEFDLDVDDDMATAAFDVDDDIDETGEFDMSDSFGSDSDTGDFDLDDADMSDVSDFDSLDAASVADIDLLEGDEAFEDDAFESEAGGAYASLGATVRPSSAVQQDWGTGPVVLSIVSMLVMLVAAFVSFDLLGNIYSWNSAEPASGVIIEQLSGMFG